MRVRKRLNQFVPLLLLTCALAYAQNPGPSDGEKSVADAAREYREKKRDIVRERPEDAKNLFASMDEILDFVSRDTGYAKHGPVNRQILGREQFNKQFGGQRKTEDEVQVERQFLERSEIVMKKFGLLPPGFKLQSYLSTEPSKSLAAFYRFSDKTMYLLDWVPLSSQKRIMAHELTHALQDQNFDLTKLMTPTTPRGIHKNEIAMSLTNTDESERLAADRAFTEGQASVVECEYFLGQLIDSTGRSFPGIGPKILESARNYLQNYEQPVSIHAAPRVLQDSLEFPYREGTAFELELLQKLGRKAAFAGVFARPPVSTHEILEPRAYIGREKVPQVTIPDLKPILGNTFEAYDNGSIGEFDVQVMAQEFGRENDLYSVVPFWKGGGYVAVKRTGATGDLTSADVALLYVSDWKSPEAAKRFAQIYKAALPKRVTVSSEEVLEPSEDEQAKGRISLLWAARVVTSEGLVFIELWPGNRLLITHGFGDKTVSKLRNLVLNPAADKRTASLNRELSMRLYQSPTFAAFQKTIGQEILERALENMIH